MRHWTLQEALLYGKGTERPFLCPVHGDSRPSASVNVVKKKWYCYTCHATGGLTGENALMEPDYELMKQWFTEKMEKDRVYPESWLSRWDAVGVHPYWEARVGTDAARHFRLGHDSERDCVTYPLRRSDGAVLGVVRRSLVSEEGPKYLYPRGVDVGHHLFNYTPDSRRVVVLCEGALDAVALWNVGITAFAIYGSHLGPAQARLIDRVDPEFVVTAYDADDAGWLAYRETRSALRHRRVLRMTWPRSWGKDVDELGEERLRKVVSDLACPGLSCVGSSSWHCGSQEAKTLRIKKTSLPSMSRPRRLRIRPTSA